MRDLRDAARRLSCDQRAISAVEFALLAPVFVLLLVGEFALGEAISISRKVAITGRVVVDLVAQESDVTESKVTSILSASAQIAAPYSSADMVIVLSHLKIDGDGNATVDWSRALHGDRLALGATVALPAGVAQANTSLIYGSVRLDYRPPVGSSLLGAIPISYSLYMNPRVSASIPLN
ncbi:pilus assembly protein [Methylosinus sp. Sm6]|nr:pilus assembly protein [Methylosinus sp. Sm6]